MYADHERVALARELPAEGLCAGAVGTIVGRYGNGGYEVEFTTADGRTLPVVTLAESDIQRRS